MLPYRPRLPTHRSVNNKTVRKNGTTARTATSSLNRGTSSDEARKASTTTTTTTARTTTTRQGKRKRGNAKNGVGRDEREESAAGEEGNGEDDDEDNDEDDDNNNDNNDDDDDGKGEKDVQFKSTKRTNSARRKGGVTPTSTVREAEHVGGDDGTSKLLHHMGGGGLVERWIRQTLKEFAKHWRSKLAAATQQEQARGHGQVPLGSVFGSFKQVFSQQGIGLLHHLAPPKSDKASYQQLLYSAALSFLSWQDPDNTDDWHKEVVNHGAFAVFLLHTLYHTCPLPSFPGGNLPTVRKEPQSPSDGKAVVPPVLQLLALGGNESDNPKIKERRYYHSKVRISQQVYMKLLQLRDACVFCVDACQATAVAPNHACQCGLARDCIELLDRNWWQSPTTTMFEFCQGVGPPTLEGLAYRQDYLERILYGKDYFQNQLRQIQQRQEARNNRRHEAATRNHGDSVLEQPQPDTTLPATADNVNNNHNTSHDEPDLMHSIETRMKQCQKHVTSYQIQMRRLQKLVGTDRGDTPPNFTSRASVTKLSQKLRRHYQDFNAIVSFRDRDEEYENNATVLQPDEEDEDEDPTTEEVLDENETGEKSNISEQSGNSMTNATTPTPLEQGAEEATAFAQEDEQVATQDTETATTLHKNDKVDVVSEIWLVQNSAKGKFTTVTQQPESANKDNNKTVCISWTGLENSLHPSLRDVLADVARDVNRMHAAQAKGEEANGTEQDDNEQHQCNSSSATNLSTLVDPFLVPNNESLLENKEHEESNNDIQNGVDTAAGDDDDDDASAYSMFGESVASAGAGSGIGWNALNELLNKAAGSSTQPQPPPPVPTAIVTGRKRGATKLSSSSKKKPARKRARRNSRQERNSSPDNHSDDDESTVFGGSVASEGGSAVGWNALSNLLSKAAAPSSSVPEEVAEEEEEAAMEPDASPPGAPEQHKVDHNSSTETTQQTATRLRRRQTRTAVAKSPGVAASARRRSPRTMPKRGENRNHEEERSNDDDQSAVFGEASVASEGGASEGGVGWHALSDLLNKASSSSSSQQHEPTEVPTSILTGPEPKNGQSENQKSSSNSGQKVVSTTATPRPRRVKATKKNTRTTKDISQSRVRSTRASAAKESGDVDDQSTVFGESVTSEGISEVGIGGNALNDLLNMAAISSKAQPQVEQPEESDTIPASVSTSTGAKRRKVGRKTSEENKSGHSKTSTPRSRRGKQSKAGVTSKVAAKPTALRRSPRTLARLSEDSGRKDKNDHVDDQSTLGESVASEGGASEGGSGWNALNDLLNKAAGSSSSSLPVRQEEEEEGEEGATDHPHPVAPNRGRKRNGPGKTIPRSTGRPPSPRRRRKSAAAVTRKTTATTDRRHSSSARRAEGVDETGNNHDCDEDESTLFGGSIASEVGGGAAGEIALSDLLSRATCSQQPDGSGQRG